jgi:hypothetical protein
MSDDVKRFPGWILVLVMTLVIGGFGLAIYLSVRPDPTLPPVQIVPK